MPSTDPTQEDRNDPAPLWWITWLLWGVSALFAAMLIVVWMESARTNGDQSPHASERAASSP